MKALSLSHTSLQLVSVADFERRRMIAVITTVPGWEISSLSQQLAS